MRIRLGRILRVIADHVDQRSDAERREERRKAAQAVADAQRGLADALRHAERVGAVTRVEPRRHRSGMDK
jgi:hypothetical protein